jgi:hypothetical protein
MSVISEIFNNFLALFSWFFTVAVWEQAIRVRLGKHVTLLHAGWYIKIPFIDRIFKQSIKMRRFVIRPQTATTLDGKAISLTSSVGFQIVDLVKLFNTLECPNDTLECEIAGLTLEYIGGHNLDECSIPAVSSYVKDKLDLSLYGLGNQEFYITSFAIVRTLRLITGDLSSWQRDSVIWMTEDKR